MNDSSLPAFKKRNYDRVLHFITRALTHEGTESRLHELVVYDDGHFRALFTPDYFTLAEGATEPTRSQFNTLKKRLKRMDRDVFVFKEHGMHAGLCYVDFGFFAEKRGEEK